MTATRECNVDHLSLAAASRLVPGRPHTSTLWRWCRRGVLARSGERIRLKHIRLGARVFTTREALDEFGRALADADAAYFADDNSRRAREPDIESTRRAALDAVDQELAREGL